MTDIDTVPLLPGFERINGRIVFTLDGRVIAPIWSITRIEPESRLSRGEIAKVSTLGGRVFLTPATGRYAWNVRRSYPRQSAIKGLPFIVAEGTDFYLYRATHGHVVLKAEKVEA